MKIEELSRYQSQLNVEKLFVWLQNIGKAIKYLG